MNEVLIPFVALLIFSVQGAYLAFVATELSRSFGPKWVGVSVFGAAAIAGVAGYFWPLLLGSSVAFTVLASALLAGGIAHQLSSVMKRQVTEQLRMASTVAKFGLDNFAQLGTRGETEIGRGHIDSARSAGKFAGGNLWLLNHMDRHLSDIGHVTNVRASVISPSGAGYVSVTHHINRRDLETYEARLKQKYRAWL